MALTRATDKIIANADGNLNLSGIVTASSFVGSGSGLTGVASTDNINTSTPATFGTIDATGISTFRKGLKVGPLTSIGATHYTDGSIRSVGIITASSFVGNLTGNLTGNVTGTASQLETNATGANLTLSGNLGVGGTITYEDVARVDATGISTFREGFKLGPLAGIALTAYKDGSIRWTGIITASSFVGDGSGLTGAGPSLANGSNNRVVTATGANALTGEANLTFTGSILTVTNSSGASELTLTTPNNTDGGVYFNDGSNAGAVSYLHTDDSMRFRVNSTEKLRITSDGLVKATNDLMVQGTVYGGNGGRRNWFDNGDMTIVSRYANCHFAGNYHSYGWVTDRYQNRGTNAQWSQDTNVPAGKGFVYSAKVNSGTSGSLCQSIELTRKGQHGMFANDTYWCVSLWSTQPINRSSNNGFCKDLGSNDYTAFDNVNPSSGNAYLETGETASGTSTGTFKRYYHIFQAPNSLSSNAFAVNFGWSINYSGSGGCYLTGFQCEQVPNANCKPSAYEHVDQATQLKRCQRYAFRQSDNSSATGQNPGYTRLINGYKRHDDDVHFNFFCPVPMTPYNNSSPPQGLSAWDVGTCTNMGGNLGGTVSNVRMAEMNWDTGWCMVMFDYSAGGTNVIIPSWEGFSFEVGGSHF